MPVLGSTKTLREQPRRLQNRPPPAEDAIVRVANESWYHTGRVRVAVTQELKSTLRLAVARAGSFVCVDDCKT